MSISKAFQGGQSIALERNKVITLTNKTVRYGTEVYQTHNIVGFGEGKVDIGTIPWILLIIILFVALILPAVPFIGSMSAFLFLSFSIGGLCWNLFKPKHYGLLMTLNSGDKKLFVTSDFSGLKHVTSTIYELIEKDREAAYQITVQNSQIKGNFVQGYAQGEFSFNEER